MANDKAPARDGRVTRTALLGFLGPGFGAGVFEDAADPFLTMLPFVLMMLISGALIIELTDQARRSQPDGEETAAACFTALYVVLAGCFCWVRRRVVSDRG